METEETFEVLSCAINKSPKLGGKLRTVYGLFGWWFPSRSAEKTRPWLPSGNLKCVWLLSLFYSLHKGINASEEFPAFSLISRVSTSTYRFLSSADCKSKLMQWNQWLCKWFPWEQEERLKCCPCARQSWESLPNSQESFFRTHCKVVGVQLQHFPCKCFTMKATMIELTYKTKSDVLVWKICHLYEV